MVCDAFRCFNAVYFLKSSEDILVSLQSSSSIALGLGTDNILETFVFRYLKTFNFLLAERSILDILPSLISNSSNFLFFFTESVVIFEPPTLSSRKFFILLTLSFLIDPLRFNFNTRNPFVPFKLTFFNWLTSKSTLRNFLQFCANMFFNATG